MNSSPDPDALREDIEGTRRRMDETIAALEQRLQPRHLLDEVVGYLRQKHDSGGTADRTSSAAGPALKKAGRTIADNPLPVAVIGLGLGWLIYNALHDEPPEEPKADTGADESTDDDSDERFARREADTDPTTASRDEIKAMLADLRRYRAFQKSQSFLESTTAARQNADRAHELASDENRIPPQGALYDLHQDAKLQGPRLFANHCAGCHDHAGEEGVGIRRERALTYKLDPAGNWLSQEPPLGNAAPNLDGFASRKWIAGLLDPDKIAHADIDTTAWLVKNAPYFGNT
jgi:mono/diheme cytochrome c family protein